MNFKSSIAIFNIICVVHLCTSLPLDNSTIAYNLHQNLSLQDINELGKDQRIKALLDVQTTIDEVEKLLITDPSLPRLTKGEIRDLFEKVTKDELNKSISSGDKEKQEFMKNLILALPYHSDEFIKLEKLALSKATTMHPVIEPTIPDELKVLLKSYGLLDNDDKNIGLETLPLLPNKDYPLSALLNQDKQHDAGNNGKPEINADSFTTFQQLKVNNKNVTEDFEQFLNKFGLLHNNSTDKKISVVKKTNSSAIKSPYLTSEYSDVLNNMGLQKPKFEALTSSKNTAPDPIKEFRKGSALKNEFKRQESNGKPTKVSLNEKPLLESSLESTDDNESQSTNPPIDITTTELPTTTELLTTTEEEKKNNLEDEIDAVDEPAQLPSPRRSGFYMIFDWNTFLEVGEDPEKIIVRFDPKVGDPSRFLPVNVP